MGWDIERWDAGSELAETDDTGGFEDKVIDASELNLENLKGELHYMDIFTRYDKSENINLNNQKGWNLFLSILKNLIEEK